MKNDRSRITCTEILSAAQGFPIRHDAKTWELRIEERKRPEMCISFYFEWHILNSDPERSISVDGGVVEIGRRHPCKKSWIPKNENECKYITINPEKRKRGGCMIYGCSLTATSNAKTTLLAATICRCLCVHIYRFRMFTLAFYMLTSFLLVFIFVWRRSWRWALVFKRYIVGALGLRNAFLLHKTIGVR